MLYLPWPAAQMRWFFGYEALYQPVCRFLHGFTLPLYVSRLEELLVTSSGVPNASGIKTSVDAALDGQPSSGKVGPSLVGSLRASGYSDGIGSAGNHAASRYDAAIFDPLAEQGFSRGFHSSDQLQCSKDLKTTMLH